MNRPSVVEVWRNNRPIGFAHKQADIMRKGGFASVAWVEPAPPINSGPPLSCGLIGHRYDFKLEWREATR